MNVELLKDAELYALTQNQGLQSDLKKLLAEEFKRRNYSTEQVDKLSMAYENLVGQSKEGLSITEKLLIISFPFFPVIQAIIANRHIGRGEQKKWKQHWNYVAIGYAVWTVLILLLARFIN